MDDWYNVTARQILKRGGSFVRYYYNDSPYKALQTIFPDHDWKRWKFKTVSMGYWTKKENQLEFFDELKETLGYHSMDNWYNITRTHVRKHGGRGIPEYHGDTPSKALQSVHPEHNWIQSNFKHALEKRKSLISQ